MFAPYQPHPAGNCEKHIMVAFVLRLAARYNSGSSHNS